MRVCMITPHLPPEQAANALLPTMLGPALAAYGVETSYVAHASHRTDDAPPDRVVYVPRRGKTRFGRTILGAAVAGGRMARAARAAIGGSDLVHLHGNGFIVEVGGFLAARYHKPSVVTLYGTDVWHHDQSRHGRFASVVRQAASRVFYSRGLLEFAKSLDLAPNPSEVIYAPVAPGLHGLDPDRRAELRRELGIGEAPWLLTVKRLHPVAGHEDLLRALPSILREFPNARLALAGEGPLARPLAALAEQLGVSSAVRFLGLVDHRTLWRYYAAADLFVLPSRLESWGTVMLEALACGTPVVATRTAGGLEVHEHFSDAVTLVAVGSPEALAQAVSETLRRPRRVDPATLCRLRTEFSVEACAQRYLSVYERALVSRYGVT
jgi:glycosyltransferase involved in cell wall biosynthesis